MWYFSTCGILPHNALGQDEQKIAIYMPMGIPLSGYIDREKVIETIHLCSGKISRVYKKLLISKVAFYDYLDVENLWPEVEKARAHQAFQLDDIALTTVEKLSKKINEEPAVALKASLEILKRKGGTRKDWAPDSQLTSQEVAILKQMLQNEIGTPDLPKA